MVLTEVLVTDSIPEPHKHYAPNLGTGQRRYHEHDMWLSPMLLQLHLQGKKKWRQKDRCISHIKPPPFTLPPGWIRHPQRSSSRSVTSQQRPACRCGMR